MVKEKNEFIEGLVTESLPNTMFRVDLDDGRKVLATLKGRMRRMRINVIAGDKVRVEMTKYDKERGRIVWKFKK